MRVFTSIELAPEATKNIGNQTFNIINNEPQREKHAAYQFFRSLLERVTLPSNLGRRWHGATSG
jgi:hypothetical protein